MTSAIFKDKNTWLGSFYELALELGGRSDERLATALHSVWSFPDVEGCYLRPHVEPEEQLRVEVPDVRTGPDKLYGVASLPGGLRVACGTFIVREEDGPDWLGFYFPMGALAKTYKEAGQPLEDSFLMLEGGVQELDNWLASLAIHIFAAVQYKLGLIGHEVSGDVYTGDLESQGIPDVRYMGYLWPEQDHVRYFPRNAQYGE